MSETKNEIPKKTIVKKGPNGEIMGQITVQTNKRGPGGYIKGLFVNESYRNQGIGGKLVDEATQYAGGHVSLEVEADNATAVRLYQERGFAVKEEVKSKDGKVYLRMEKI